MVTHPSEGPAPPRRRSLTFSCSSFSRNDTGWPWRFPDGEVTGVFRSAWASTQMTQRSGHCWAWPHTDPIPRLEEGQTSGTGGAGGG